MWLNRKERGDHIACQWGRVEWKLIFVMKVPLLSERFRVARAGGQLCKHSTLLHEYWKMNLFSPFPFGFYPSATQCLLWSRGICYCSSSPGCEGSHRVWRRSLPPTPQIIPPAAAAASAPAPHFWNAAGWVSPHLPSDLLMPVNLLEEETCPTKQSCLFCMSKCRSWMEKMNMFI